jgi:hypothetical protein
MVSASRAQVVPRKIGELRLGITGVAATVEPLEPSVPKNVASAVRVIVKAGPRVLGVAEVEALLGGGFRVLGDLSGPGLPTTLGIPDGDGGLGDPLLLPLPALSIGGDYPLANLRVVGEGGSVLDVVPASVTAHVIDQILVTSVTTRALTLDEIREKGIVLDSDDYLGFQFNMGLRLESEVVKLEFPVVFNRSGAVVPLPSVGNTRAARNA